MMDAMREALREAMQMDDYAAVANNELTETLETSIATVHACLATVRNILREQLADPLVRR